MRNKGNFSHFIRVWGIIFLTGLGACFICIDVISTYRDFNLRAAQIRSEYIDRQKQIIKQEVMRAVETIRHRRSQSEALTREKIKSRVYEAYAIAHHLHQQYQSTANQAAIQQMVLNALRPIRFENGSGYYFATRLDGVEMLFADRPQMEGRNLLDMQDTRGQYVIRGMIEIARQSGEGFYEYHWTKPGLEGNDFKKISFVKRFAPWDWFIGTGLYVDDVEEQIKAQLLLDISRIRFGREGYIFINRLNGDILVSNGKRFSGTKKLWEVFDDNPEKMREIFEKEYQAAQKPGGGYIQYSHIKLSQPERESPKVSFIFGLPEFQWLAGAGVYLDDVENDIARMHKELTRQVIAKNVVFAFAVITVVGLFFLFFIRLNNRLKKDLHHLLSYFSESAHTDEAIDRKQIKFIEFDRIAEYANRMLADRIAALKALRESEEKYRLLVETANEAIFIAQDNVIKFPNPKTIEMTGYTEKELAAVPFVKLIHPDDRQMVADRHRRRLNGEALPSDYSFRIIDKKGSERSVQINAAVTTWEGRPATINLIRDITEQKQLEKRLRHSQKMESIGTLAGGIAHEFNNMLGIIIGNAELAVDDIPDVNPARTCLEEIRTASLRAKNVVRKLMRVAQKTPAFKKPIQIRAVITEALDLIRKTIPRTIDLRLDIRCTRETVLGDPSEISQVVINLCTNALHAMREQTGALSISLEPAAVNRERAAHRSDLPPGDYVRLMVKDTGEGIEPAIMDRVFDPYFTTKAVDEGLGMGLAVVDGIIKHHNGSIHIHSEPGKGTTVEVLLPLIEKQHQTQPGEDVNDT